MKKIVKIVNGIYSITNLTTSRVYIGRSNNIQRRFKHHVYCLDRGVHANPVIQKDWIEYGQDSFSFEVLYEFTDTDDIKKVEREWILRYRANSTETGYNLTHGSLHNVVDFKKSSEDSTLGIWVPPNRSEDVVCTKEEIIFFKDRDQNAFFLLMILRSNHRHRKEFYITNSMSFSIGWCVRKLIKSRNFLLENGFIISVMKSTGKTPSVYAWPVRNDIDMKAS